MLKPISKNFRGIIIINGPTNSGKSQLAEYLIKEQDSITYIATSNPRPDDEEWQSRIDIHRKRRPDDWKLIEHPADICESIQSINDNDSILLDSLGGLVEQHIMKDDYQWHIFQDQFIKCLINNNLGIIVVAEEIGWGVVPATRLGHIFRERLSKLSSLLSSHAKKKWLAVNGTAIDLDKLGDSIP